MEMRHMLCKILIILLAYDTLCACVCLHVFFSDLFVCLGSGVWIWAWLCVCFF